MPEKPLTVATYAAGASLAAITLVYVFAPTYFIDGDSNAARKKGVVGLANPANDCFINSVLQALAGLTDLRIYLIRETHRRAIDEPRVYQELVTDPARMSTPDWKMEGLQAGLVTKGLKDVLDALNERPIYKKTITATGFVRVLEVAFGQRISRQQQDAQEFLQVVAERVCDEYHAGKRARRHARRKGRKHQLANGHVPKPSVAVPGNQSEAENGMTAHMPLVADKGKQTVRLVSAELPAEEGPRGHEHHRLDSIPDYDDREDEDGFPVEGRYESQIECLTCSFKPKPTESTFCSLTLNVPQASATTLNACLDGVFKTEYIDDFKCEKCRLVHAKSVLEAELARSTSTSFRATAVLTLQKLQQAINTEPEQMPPDVVLPDMQYAPKRKIARHTRLTSFPKIMAIHLSRSIYDAAHISTKNSAKVDFPERLALGGLLNQGKYKLLALVTHKGSHHSGHYETFRRQNTPVPFSTPNAFQPSGVFAKSGQAGATAHTQATPHAVNGQAVEGATRYPDGPASPGPSLGPTPPTVSAGLASRTSHHSSGRRSSASASRDHDSSDTRSLRSVAASAKSTVTKMSQCARNSCNGYLGGKSSSEGSTKPNGTSAASGSGISLLGTGRKKRSRHGDRWWRISDEKIKEAKTSEVLGVQREVYLLFYELERREETEAEP